MSYKQNVIRFHTAASAAGLNYEQAETLRRAAQTLHTWSERECNGTVYRAEAGALDHKGRELKPGRTYAVSNINGPGPLRYYPTPDRESGALRRARAVLTALPEGTELDYQGDPRGWPLRIKLPDGRELCPPCR